MTKTTAASAATGNWARVPVNRTSTISTTAAAVSEASWLRPPALSVTWVWVGLPLTTNVPENAAATLAAPRPIRSASWLNGSSWASRRRCALSPRSGRG